jgi:hypothetical protein
MKKINKNNGIFLGHYLCTSFSPVIQQQQKHFLSHMMEIHSPNLNVIFSFVGHLHKNPNVEHQNSS